MSSSTEKPIQEEKKQEKQSKPIVSSKIDYSAPSKPLFQVTPDVDKVPLHERIIVDANGK